jgi:cyclopropane fatty-acyl-phospholipid synthase-like methyltransferase
MTEALASSTERPGGWDAYWEELSDRQKLFREQAAEYVRNLSATGLLDPRARVMDFGCGFGYVADGVAPYVGELLLWDSSRNMRERAAAAVAGRCNVHPIDLSDGEAVARVRFDLILVNSVVQYMTRRELAGWLGRWRDMLSPAGRIVLSDLIPPQRGGIADIADLLRFSASRGFLLRALWQAVGELGRYRRMRQAAPLMRLGREDLEALAEEEGLAVTFLPRNLTHFRERIAAVCSRAA